MNNTQKLMLSAVLTSTLLSNMILPSFAQYNNYGNKPYSQNYDQGYNNYGNKPYSQNYNQGYNNDNYSLPPLKGHVVTIPPGTQLSAMTQGELSSENLTVGDTIAVQLSNGFYYNGTLALPPGTSVQGNVVIAERSGFTGKSGRLKIKFTNAITPTGQRIPLSGKLATNDNTGVLVGGTGAQRLTRVAKNTAGGAALGALAGVIISPLSGGKIGRGTALSTAVGGGLGLGKSVIDKGKQAVLPAGSSVKIVLDQPARINLNKSYNQNYNY